MLVGGLIGLVAVGAGLTAYRLAARSAPSPDASQGVDLDPERLERLLESASWTPMNEASRPVYVVGPRRDVAAWLRRDDAPEGREIRIIPVLSDPPAPGETALLAELWLSREPELVRLWLRTRPERWSAGRFPDPQTDLAREGVVEAVRRFTASVNASARGPDDAGRWPLLFWRDAKGALSVCVCDTGQAAGRARAELRLEPVVEAARPEPEPDPAVLSYPHMPSPAPGSLPTPSASVAVERRPLGALQPSPRLPGDPAAGPPPPAQASPAAPARRSPSRPAPSRRSAPPEAQRDADSLFF